MLLGKRSRRRLSKTFGECSIAFCLLIVVSKYRALQGMKSDQPVAFQFSRCVPCASVEDFEVSMTEFPEDAIPYESFRSASSTSSISGSWSIG